MPKKGKGKKGKKEKKPVRVETKYDDWELPRIEAQTAKYKDLLDKAAMDRNQVQMDKDAVQQFYDITRRELRELELGVLAKEKEMEVMEENHRVEVRVYAQKVKHLEYEHQNTLGRITTQEDELVTGEGSTHGLREAELRRKKAELRETMADMERKHAAAVSKASSDHERYLSSLRDSFQQNMVELKARYDARLAKLRRDLELQRKVETHEVEERKNQHIADLVANHETQFAKMKAFYNEITRRNLQTITDLKAKIDDMNEKQVANQALMVDIAEENKTLADPLTVATAEVQSLRADLRDASKDRLALRNAKARIRKLDDDIAQLQRSISKMEGGFSRVERERDELTDKFQATVSAMQVKADQRNAALEGKLDSVQDEFDEKSAQLQEVLTAASLDPAVIGMVSSRLDAILDARNRIIKELQHQVARVTKSHNDALRVFEAKLRDMGVDTGDMPFVPLPTTTTVAPAGLVAAPRFKARREMGGAAVGI